LDYKIGNFERPGRNPDGRTLRSKYIPMLDELMKSGMPDLLIRCDGPSEAYRKQTAILRLIKRYEYPLSTYRQGRDLIVHKKG
jgi:hypothetical protein